MKVRTDTLHSLNFFLQFSPRIIERGIDSESICFFGEGLGLTATLVFVTVTEFFRFFFSNNKFFLHIYIKYKVFTFY